MWMPALATGRTAAISMPSELDKLTGLVPQHLQDPAAHLDICAIDLGQGRRADLIVHLSGECGAIEEIAADLRRLVSEAARDRRDLRGAAAAAYRAAAARHCVLAVELRMEWGDCAFVLRSQK